MKITFSFNYYAGFLAVLMAAFLWGTAGTAASFAIGLNPVVLATISVGIGGLIHTLLSFKSIIKYHKKLFNYKTQLLLGVIASICCPLFFYSSVSFAGVSIGTVLSIGCAPLFSVILEWLFDQQKLLLKWLISFIFGISGVILLSYSGETHSNVNILQSERILGVIFGLLSSLSYASYSFIMRNLIHKDIDARAAMGSIFGICALLVLPTLFFTGKNLLVYPVNLWVALYIPIVPMFLGYLFFSFGLKRIPASQAMTLALVEIPVAAILAVLLLGESLNFSSYLGLISIFLCVIILTRK